MGVASANNALHRLLSRRPVAVLSADLDMRAGVRLDNGFLGAHSDQELSPEGGGECRLGHVKLGGGRLFGRAPSWRSSRFSVYTLSSILEFKASVLSRYFVLDFHDVSFCVHGFLTAATPYIGNELCLPSTQDADALPDEGVY